MDKFGSPLKEGSNLEVLRKGKDWFSNKGIEVIKYLHCDKNKTRNKAHLSREDLKECCICGKELHKISEESRYVSNGKENIEIAQKRHLVFVDKSGEKHYTCYGLNRCFKRVGYEFEDTDKEVEFTPPSFKEFCEPKVNCENIDSYMRESAEKYYKKIVVGFIDKWFYKSINKNNVIEFMHDLERVENHFLYPYCEPRLISYFKEKIFNIIGVDI